MFLKKTQLKKKRPSYIYCLQETNVIIKDTHRLKVKEWEKVYSVKMVTKREQGYLYQTKFNFKKVLNITHYQRNANQTHNEVPLHTSQDGCYPKVYKQ